ncbi:HAMP domain-containing sensor histidine kinase [Ruminococcus sp. HUN007]|uniref:sensor histidine kinase n=1 Tax=Ruminococcus sp. HUN007 TaxID=1514668 RepID=UPI0005D1A02F|nr:HAMP domain-containing sensor histidine kinase [Ruminococcus sp. HUN007]
MAIGGYAENILDGKLTDEEQKEYLEAIIENVEFADSTMSRTLMLNSMDGNAGFKYETTDVGKVVSEVVKKYEPLLEQNNISFSLEGSATVKAESTSFEKIVENLISNAVKYTPDNGSIKVTADRKKTGHFQYRKRKDRYQKAQRSFCPR